MSISKRFAWGRPRDPGEGAVKALRTSRALTREDAFLIFSSCALPVFLWAIFKLFARLSGLMLRLNLSDLLGAVSYVLTAALFEGLLFFVLLFSALFLVSRLLPAKLLGDHLAPVGAMLATLLSGMAIYFQLNFERVLKLTPKRMIFYLGLVGLAFLIYYLLILRFPRFEKIVLVILRRLSVLSLLYVALGILGLLVIIFRNILLR